MLLSPLREYLAADDSQRAILVNFRPSPEETLSLLSRVIEDWVVFEFVMNVLAAQLGEYFTEWQVNQIFTMMDPGVLECLDCRCRGGSKTRDGAIACILIALAEPKTSGMWLAANTTQLAQALKYVRALEERTFLGAVFRVRNNKFTHMKEAICDNESSIQYNPSTATSGPRTNLLWFDEEGKLDKSDLIENNRNAYGMVTSAKGLRRIRHTTTLSVGTPAQDVYERLNKIQMVFIHLPEDCTWWTEADWKLLDQYKLTMPRWWVNCEYYCRLDAPGGRVFTDQHDLSIFSSAYETPLDFGPGSIITIIRPGETQEIEFKIDNHWTAHGGTDWNPSWGHTFVVGLTNGTEWFIVDEYRGTNLEHMAEFIKRWQNHDFWRNGWTYVAEKQGSLKTTQSRADTLRTLGVNITCEENFSMGEQIKKLSYAEALNEQKRLHFWTYCGAIIRQAQFYRRSEDTGLPAKKQEDHLVDAMLHMFNPPTVQMKVGGGFSKWK